VLCLAKASNIDIHLFQTELPHDATGYHRYLGRSGEDYRCGVFGFSVADGKLDTSEEYKIMAMVQTSLSNNVWSVWAQMPSPSSRDLENWEIDLACLSFEYVLWDVTFDCSAGSCRYVG
jgi:hypothetical protein